jgi:hypothetical protein
MYLLGEDEIGCGNYGNYGDAERSNSLYYTKHPIRMCGGGFGFSHYLLGGDGYGSGNGFGSDLRGGTPALLLTLAALQRRIEDVPM